MLAPATPSAPNADEPAPNDLAASTSELLEARDILTTPDFDPVECINVIFPTEQSLATIDRVLSKLRVKMQLVDREIRDLVRAQTDAGTRTIHEVDEIRAAIAALFERVRSIKGKAHDAEAGVQEMTREIQALDRGRLHLAQTSTFLRRYHLLSATMATLRARVPARQYRQCGELLACTQLLVKYFGNFATHRAVVALVDSVRVLELELKRAVLADFDTHLGPLGASAQAVERVLPRLRDGCAVAEVLEASLGMRTQLVTWFCDLQLREYRALFVEATEESGLDQVARRYAWLKRIMKSYDARERLVFPQEWQVGRTLCLRFCDDTRRNLGDLVRKAGDQLDVKVLLQAFLVTLEFEGKLAKRFHGSEPGAVFHRSITQALEPALSLYVAAEDASLQRAFAEYRQRQPLNDCDENVLVLGSSTDLFYTYRQLVLQMSRFSTGKPWLELSELLERWLLAYGTLLVDTFPPGFPQGSSVRIGEDAPRTLSASEVRTAALLVNTADYCRSATAQLAEKLRSRADPAFQAQITLGRALERFDSVATGGLRVLDRALEAALEPGLLAMLKVLWGALKQVGDTSEYVGSLSAAYTHVTSAVAQMTRHDDDGVFVHLARFNEQAVATVFTRLYGNLFRCRPLGEIGAEQMLLDVHTLRSIVLRTTTYKAPGSGPPTGDSKLTPELVASVHKHVARIEAVLKMAMTRLEPNEAFVTSFKHLFGGDLGATLAPGSPLLTAPSSPSLQPVNRVTGPGLFSEFNVGTLQRILELKGARRVEAIAIIELFTQIYGEVPGALDTAAPLAIPAAPSPDVAAVAPADLSVSASASCSSDSVSGGSAGPLSTAPSGRHVRETSTGGEKFKRFMAMSVNGLKGAAANMSMGGSVPPRPGNSTRDH